MPLMSSEYLISRQMPLQLLRRAPAELQRFHSVLTRHDELQRHVSNLEISSLPRWPQISQPCEGHDDSRSLSVARPCEVQLLFFQPHVFRANTQDGIRRQASSYYRLHRVLLPQGSEAVASWARQRNGASRRAHQGEFRSLGQRARRGFHCIALYLLYMLRTFWPCWHRCSPTLTVRAHCL